MLSNALFAECGQCKLTVCKHWNQLTLCNNAFDPSLKVCKNCCHKIGSLWLVIIQLRHQGNWPSLGSPASARGRSKVSLCNRKMVFVAFACTRESAAYCWLWSTSVTLQFIVVFLICRARGVKFSNSQFRHCFDVRMLHIRKPASLLFILECCVQSTFWTAKG